MTTVNARTITRQATQRTCNTDVAKAQRQLNAHANRSIIAEDGALGSKTEAAIRAFQKENNLPETGALDEKTLKLLNAPPQSKSLAEPRQAAAIRSYAAQNDALTRMLQIQGRVTRAANDNF